MEAQLASEEAQDREAKALEEEELAAAKEEFAALQRTRAENLAKKESRARDYSVDPVINAGDEGVGLNTYRGNVSAEAVRAAQAAAEAAAQREERRLLEWSGARRRVVW